MIPESSNFELHISHWNYRVVKKQHADGSIQFSIREVYYGRGLRVEAWTEEESAPSGETLRELKADIRYMTQALSAPVLDESKLEAALARRQISQSPSRSNRGRSPKKTRKSEG